ncbi:MAG: hypothetical protein RL186_1539, partial [Pseudomonadota bacterium]
VVSAEDIGKLPDVSIAESLARLPGLAAERIDGRSQRISIRGLGPNYTTSLLNGREQVSTNDARGIEFDQYPAELLGSVNVYKTAEPGLAAQGIAGTVDMRTVRPLAFGRRAVVVSGRYQFNTLGEVLPDVDPNGYRFTASYIDQFMDGKLGIALGAAHMYNPSSTQRTEAYDVSTTGAKTTDGVGLGTLLSPGGWKVNASTTAVTRTGYMGVLEYKPTDNLSMTLDAYYSTFLSEQHNRGVEVNLGDDVNLGWIRSTVKSANNYVTEGTFRGTYAVRNIYNENDAEVKAVGFRTDYNLTSATKIGFDFGYSAATRDSVFIETQPCVLDAAGTACKTSDIGYSLRPDGGLRLTIADNLADPSKVVLADPYGWGDKGYIKKPTIDDELKTYRLDVTHELGGNSGVKSLEFAVHYSDRRKERTYREGFLKTANALTPIPANLIAGTVDLGFGGLGNALVFNPVDLINAGVFKEVIGNEWWQGQSDWNVDEKVTTASFKANIDTAFADVPVTGNFGLQYVHTDQSSDGFWVGSFFANGGSDGGVYAVESGIDYAELLPSLNLSFEPAENLYVRVALGRVLSRLNMEDMRITRQIGFDASKIDSTNPYDSPYRGDGGNPWLRPTISQNADISIEKYFGARAKGYVSFALFQKNLETYLRPGGDRYFIDVSGLPTPILKDGNGKVILGEDGLPKKPKILTAFVTTPGNAKGGSIKGLEFALSVPFELFAPSLEGFGATLNVAQNYSSVEYADSRSGYEQLPGLSKTTANLTAYYEKHGFQARVSARHRSPYLQEIVNYKAEIERRVNEPETIVDAQLGYEFQEGSAFKGLSIVLQALNLTDEPWENSYVEPTRGLNYDTFGTTYQLGVTYKF